MKISSLQAFSVAGLLSLVAFVALLVNGALSAAGCALVAFFVLLALAARSYESTRVFRFTFWVFAAVAAAMFFPNRVGTIAGSDTSTWIVPIVQLIMFGMGTALRVEDFAAVVRRPQSVMIGAFAQYSIMPLLAFGIVTSLQLPPEIAAGVILIGSAPGGVASNVMTFIARGDLALSITLTSFSTLLAPLLTPFLMTTLAGQFVPISFLTMMGTIINMVVLPIGAALLLNAVLRSRNTPVHRAMPAVSMVLLILVLAFITAAGRDNLLVIGPLLIVAVLVHNSAGYLVGYWLARLIRLDEASCRTVAIEVGMQNGGLAGGIAAEMGRAATMGMAPAVFSSWQNVSGSVLASWWRNRPAAGPEPRVSAGHAADRDERVPRIVKAT